MVNKKTIIAGFFLAFAILAISIYAGQSTQASESPTPNAKAPPTVPLETPSTQSQADVQTLELSESNDNVVCDQPPKDNKYGGISGSENKPPKGTTIVEPKTGNRVTATGTCGTYWYIAGWWFTASEMANLPSDTLMYGTSPYITSGGPGGSAPSNVETAPAGSNNPGDGNTVPGDDNVGSGDDNEEPGDDNPVVPVSEVATFVLVALGIFGFVAWRKTRK